MIGIDIIDLSCSFAQTKYGLVEYQKKILNKTEFFLCDSFDDLSCIWAIKESAYKCYFKETGHSFFNPKRILVTSLDRTLSTFTVQIDDHLYAGRFNQADQYIYAICFNQAEISEETKIFMEPLNNLVNGKNEACFFGNNEIEKPSFLLHSLGFPIGIALNDRLFAYSRSHHGSYYISVICPSQHN